MDTVTASRAPAADGLILAINSGSSSLKLGFFERLNHEEQPLLTGIAEGIGRQDGQLRLLDPHGTAVLQLDHIAESQPAALAKLVEVSRQHLPRTPAVIGHRVVHGGPELTEHQPVTEELLHKLQSAVHFAPVHIPSALSLIRQAQDLFPGTPNIACFDTAFHRTLPEVARRFPLPVEFDRMGVHRYGFHGLSYESVVHRLGDRLPPRTIVAHLGNGSSLCALRSAHSIETTMGLTPTGGIPMATRSGDLDPGVLLFLMRSQHMTADDLESLLNQRSGLKAIGGDSDMKALLARSAAGDEPARAAVASYVHAIRLVLGAYSAALSGLDLLVFTGGIGEHSAEIRSMICRDMEILGLSDEPSSSRILVLPTDEERQIARICRSFLNPGDHRR